MKNSIYRLALAALFTAVALPAAAQVDLSAHQEAMQKLVPLVGEWQGTGESFRGQEPERTEVTEKVSLRLDGTAIVLEGLGTHTDDQGNSVIDHQAIGILWYDASEQKYRMKAFVPGRTTDAEVEVQDQGLIWGFDVPNGGQVRYTLTFTDDTWEETGEYTSDGETWRPFFKMSLRRVDENG